MKRICPGRSSAYSAGNGSLTFTIRSALREHRGVRIHERGARLFVFRVGIARAGARAAFDEHLMAALDELIRAGGQQRHAIFLLFDFPGNADDHAGTFGPSLAAELGLDPDVGAISSRACARLTSASIVTDAAAWRSASWMRANSP